MNRILIKDIRQTDDANLISTVQIRRKTKKLYNSGATAIEFLLSDISGVMKGIKFTSGEEDIDQIFEDVRLGDIYEISGTYSTRFNSFKISMLKKIDDFNLQDFIEIPDIDVESLMKAIETVIEGLENIHLKNLSKFIFKDNEIMEKFKSAPSAIRMHHAYPRGNLEHIVGVMKVCKTLIDYYKATKNPNINEDLLLFGAIFHDIGKIFAYKEYNGIIIKTEQGEKLDHITLGNIFMSKAISSFRDFPEKLKLDILHLILSHHGREDWGSPVPPKIPEAQILHLADLIDSRFKKSLEGKFQMDL